MEEEGLLWKSVCAHAKIERHKKLFSFCNLQRRTFPTPLMRVFFSFSLSNGCVVIERFSQKQDNKKLTQFTIRAVCRVVVCVMILRTVQTTSSALRECYVVVLSHSEKPFSRKLQKGTAYFLIPLFIISSESAS